MTFEFTQYNRIKGIITAAVLEFIILAILFFVVGGLSGFLVWIEDHLVYFIVIITVLGSATLSLALFLMRIFKDDFTLTISNHIELRKAGQIIANKPMSQLSMLVTDLDNQRLQIKYQDGSQLPILEPIKEVGKNSNTVELIIQAIQKQVDFKSVFEKQLPQAQGNKMARFYSVN